MATQIIKAEVFAEGFWNGQMFKSADLETIVSSFDLLSLSGRVPLKLTHDGPDARDEPESRLALGWVRRIWKEGSKLLAELEVPARVATAIKDGFLRFCSVELLRNVQADTRTIPWVLDAVALLGSEQPAVGILRDLGALMTRASLQCESRAVFTRSTTHGDLHGMTELEQKLTKQLIDQMFTSAIENGRLLPRDQYAFGKRYPDGSATLEDAQRWIADSPKPSKQFNRTQASSRTGGNDVVRDGDAGGALVAMARELAEEKHLDLSNPAEFDRAIILAMRRDPTLAQRYKSAILGED